MDFECLLADPRCAVKRTRLHGTAARDAKLHARASQCQKSQPRTPRRPPGHVRWLLRQLSFFGFKVTATKTASTGSETIDVACLLGFAPTVLIMAYVGGLSEGANGLRKTLQQTRLGGSRKSIRSGIGSCFGTSPVGCSCVISWRKRNCSSCAIRVVLRSEFIGMEPGIYRAVSNLKQTSLDAETAPLSPEAVLPD